MDRVAGALLSRMSWPGITQEQSEEQLEIFVSTGMFDFFNISGGGRESRPAYVRSRRHQNGIPKVRQRFREPP